MIFHVCSVCSQALDYTYTTLDTIRKYTSASQDPSISLVSGIAFSCLAAIALCYTTRLAFPVQFLCLALLCYIAYRSFRSLFDENIRLSEDLQAKVTFQEIANKSLELQNSLSQIVEQLKTNIDNISFNDLKNKITAMNDILGGQTKLPNIIEQTHANSEAALSKLDLLLRSLDQVRQKLSEPNPFPDV